MKLRQLNSTNHPILLYLGTAGLTPTIQLSKDGGALTPASGSITELSLGFYKLAGNSIDRNKLGDLGIYASGGSTLYGDVYTIVDYNPFTSETYYAGGLTSSDFQAAK